MCAPDDLSAFARLVIMPNDTIAPHAELRSRVFVAHDLCVGLPGAIGHDTAADRMAGRDGGSSPSGIAHGMGRERRRVTRQGSQPGNGMPSRQV
jgi:hypothetical protein